MNDNPASLPARHVVYQVIATRLADSGVQTLRARLGTKPFLIGSGKSANMLLDNPAILPVQIRLLSSTTGQVLLTNLGEDENVRMNGEPLPNLVPTYWKPGLGVSIADFDLQLVTLVDEEGDGHLERVRPAVITQASEIALERDGELNFVIEWGDSRDVSDDVAEPPDNNTVMFAKGAMLVDDDAGIDDKLELESEAEDTREGWKLESPPEVIVAPPPPPHSLPDLPEPLPMPVIQAMPPIDDTEATPTESMPPGLKLPQLDESDGYPAVTDQTLPKNWQSAGKLSAQLTADFVNLVAGERVRIPVSVRNEGSSLIQLRIHVAGLPKDWTAVPEPPLDLAPGDIKSIDVILETHPPFHQAYIDSLLRIHDQLSPDTNLTLPLRLNFKTAPNIVGRLSPTHLAAPQSSYLNLHNHTQVPITAYITGHSLSPDLHVIPTQAQVELPPGQTLEIPINLSVLRRPWLRGARHQFAVTVRHSNRAALDYPGEVRIRPRISSTLLILFAILLVALFAAWRILGNNTPAVVVPPSTVTSSQLPAVVEQTESVTQEVEATDEARSIAPQKTATPRPNSTPTERPTVTPRPTSTPLPPTITVAITDILPTPTTPILSATTFDDPRPAGCVAAIPDGWNPYTVQAGDRVFRLAMNAGTTIEEVASVNCLTDPRILQIGQVLLLPIP
jgi:LysM repeat protein